MSVEVELTDATYFGIVLADFTNQRRGARAHKRDVWCE
jgi:hypothetical protein